jgi:hypothetical protein
VSRNSVRGNTTYYIRIFYVAIYPYCYNVCSMHIHPNAIYNYVAIKAIVTISIVATIISYNVSLCGNNHNCCSNIKNHCRVLLQCYCLLPLLIKVTLLLFKGITTNMTLLQSYFTVVIDCFFSSACGVSRYWILTEWIFNLVLSL